MLTPNLCRDDECNFLLSFQTNSTASYYTIASFHIPPNALLFIIFLTEDAIYFSILTKSLPINHNKMQKVFINYVLLRLKSKAKSVSLQARGAQRFPGSQVSQITWLCPRMVVRLSALRTGRFLPPGKYSCYSFLLDGVIGIFHWFNPSDRTMTLE